jgi:hypothetical protein
MEAWAQQIINEALARWEGVEHGKVSLVIEGHYYKGRLNALHVKPFADSEHRPPKEEPVVDRK